MRLSVIVPFLNEREVLPACLQRLRRVLDGLNESYEIVFVDDGSRDGSAEFLAARIRTEPGLKLLRLSRNFGKEAAMTAGIEHAVGAAIVILDADLQDPPELIPDMVRAWREGADVVCMRRRSRAGELAQARLGLCLLPAAEPAQQGRHSRRHRRLPADEPQGSAGPAAAARALPLHEGHVRVDRPAHPHPRLRPRSAPPAPPSGTTWA